MDSPADMIVLEDDAAALLAVFQRMVEAGIVPSVHQWESWGALAQNLWLQARQEVLQAKIALAAQVFADSIGLALVEGPPQGGTLAEDMVMDRLPETAQDAIALNRLKRRAAAEAMLAAAGE